MRDMKTLLMTILLSFMLLTTNQATQTHHSDDPSNANFSIPVFSFWFLTITSPGCNLDTGECVMVMTNNGGNSSYDLAIASDYCSMDIIYASNNTATYYTEDNGTVGGQILSGLPFGTNATATCTMPSSLLTHEPNNQPATGSFTMKLVGNLSGTPAGQTASAPFFGTWFEPPALSTVTTTLTPTQTVTLNNVVTTTSVLTETSTTTLTQTSQVSSLGYQALIAGLAAIAIVTSYLAFRGRKPN